MKHRNKSKKNNMSTDERYELINKYQEELEEKGEHLAAYALHIVNGAIMTDNESAIAGALKGIGEAIKRAIKKAEASFN
jgi:acyl-CoA reductase-like NAD-dependent aldehyde dehydrogenase